MKAFFRWLGGIIGSALALALGVALLPYAKDLIVQVMPDAASSALRTSAILSTQMRSSARLETIRISEEGVYNYDFDIGELVIGHVTTKYMYNANYGVDLNRVEMMVTGSDIVFVLPQPELMFDELVELESDRQTFAIGTFTDESYREMMEQEKLRCRERYVSGENRQAVLDSTVKAMEETVSSWMKHADSRISIRYAFADPETEASR